jgi:hypothetical protein
MIKDPIIPNTKIPESQTPPPIESLRPSDKKRKNEKFSHNAVRKFARDYFESIITSGGVLIIHLWDFLLWKKCKAT